MNKTLSVMLAAGLLVSGVAGAAEKPAVAFTPEQEARIGEIAKDYLLAHPEVLVEVSQKLQAQQQEKQQQAMTAAVVQNQAALLNDKGTPSYGPADAKVTVVEFFDYQCIYCARLAPELEKYKEEFKDIAKSEEDVLSLALFPQVAPKFLEQRDHPERAAAPAAPVPAPQPPKAAAAPGAVRELYVEDVSLR